MLQIDGVSYRYGDELALSDVTLTAPAGELIALTGPNGSGKSTLLKIVARVFAPHSGRVLFENKPAIEWPAKEYAKSVGYLPQDPDPVFPMRALDVVVSGRSPFLGRFSWESEEDWRLAAEALSACDAKELAGRYLDEMSGGERKRVFLARVLAGAPRLILLDEPLAALDLSHVQQFSLLLRQIVDRTGATVIFAAHDLNWAAAHSDRMVVMQKGRLALQGKPSDVMRPDVMRELFGYDARTVSESGKTWVVPNVPAS
jgi:ABC-type cobalamin/Fe3+-siderophores transport system ATPase subunit